MCVQTDDWRDHPELWIEQVHDYVGPEQYG